MSILLLKQLWNKELESSFRESEIQYFWKCIYEDVLRYGSIEITEDELRSYSDKLRSNMPIEYITGWTYFYDIKLEVGPSVLIPRPETEELVDLIIKDYKNKNQALQILEIGSGSGCIALALKKHLHQSDITSIDISSESILQAKKNASYLGLELTFIPLDFLDQSMWSSLGMYDIIVSNPPYIAPSEKASISASTLRYEPDLALYSPEEDPMVFYRMIAVFGRDHLTDQGVVYAELNPKFAQETAAFYKEYYQVSVIKDLQAKDRILKGTKKLR